jgi:hypothetical protein
MCLVLHRESAKGITRKYYVSLGIRSVALSPFSNICLNHLDTDLPSITDERRTRADRVKETYVRKKQIQNAGHFNP